MLEKLKGPGGGNCSCRVNKLETMQQEIKVRV